MTMMRSLISATAARSWVIRMIAMRVCSRSCADQLGDLRLDRDVQRGAGLVGDQQIRLAQQAHGDHHALAHAAGVFVRILPDALLRIRDAHRAQHFDRVRPGLVARQASGGA